MELARATLRIYRYPMFWYTKAISLSRSKRGAPDPVAIRLRMATGCKARRAAELYLSRQGDLDDGLECEEWLAQPDGTFRRTYRPDTDLPALKEMAEHMEGMSLPSASASPSEGGAEPCRHAPEEQLSASSTAKAGGVNRDGRQQQQRPELEAEPPKRPRTAQGHTACTF